MSIKTDLWRPTINFSLVHIKGQETQENRKQFKNNVHPPVFKRFHFQPARHYHYTYYALPFYPLITQIEGFFSFFSLVVNPPIPSSWLSSGLTWFCNLVLCFWAKGLTWSVIYGICRYRCISHLRAYYRIFTIPLSVLFWNFWIILIWSSWRPRRIVFHITKSVLTSDYTIALCCILKAVIST